MRKFIAVLVSLLLIVSIIPTIGVQNTALAASKKTESYTEHQKLRPNGWAGLEHLKGFSSGDKKVIDENGMKVWVQIREIYGFGTLTWIIQNSYGMKDTSIEFDVYYQIRGEGVYSDIFVLNTMSQPDGTSTHGNPVEIADLNDLIEVRIGEIRRKPLVAVSRVEIPSTLNLMVGKSATLNAEVFPSEATNKQVWFKSSNKKIAKVNDETGKVTGVKAGTATITVTTYDGKKTAKCKVKVTKPIKLKSISKLNPMYLTVGEPKMTPLKLNPKNATVTVAFTSSNSAVATVDGNGLVTARNVGKTAIAVKAGSKTRKFDVTVGKIAATSVRLDRKKVSVKRKGSVQLVATVLPAATSPDTITWTTNKKKVAIVSPNGVVTGLRKGKATITATTWNGKKVTCKVTVK